MKETPEPMGLDLMMFWRALLSVLRFVVSVLRRGMICVWSVFVSVLNLFVSVSNFVAVSLRVLFSFWRVLLSCWREEVLARSSVFSFSSWAIFLVKGRRIGKTLARSHSLS